MSTKSSKGGGVDLDIARSKEQPSQTQENEKQYKKVMKNGMGRRKEKKSNHLKRKKKEKKKGEEKKKQKIVKTGMGRDDLPSRWPAVNVGDHVVSHVLRPLPAPFQGVLDVGTVAALRG